MAADDEEWKKERLEKILGKYKDVLVKSGDETSEKRKETMEEGWRRIIEEERKRVEDGTFFLSNMLYYYVRDIMIINYIMLYHHMQIYV